MSEPASMKDRRILVVEDEFFICEELVAHFEAQGAEVVGPASNLTTALAIVDAEEDIDGAVIDICLCGEMSFPLAARLLEREIPFVFATGYDAEIIPAEFERVVRCEKPVDPHAVGKALFGAARGSTIR